MSSALLLKSCFVDGMFNNKKKLPNGVTKEIIPLRYIDDPCSTSIEIPGSHDQLQSIKQEAEKQHLLSRPMQIVNDALDFIGGSICRLFGENKTFKYLFYGVLLLTYVVYVIAACVLDLERAKFLLIFSVTVCICLVYSAVKCYCATAISNSLAIHFKTQSFYRFKKLLKWFCAIAFVVSLGVWIIFDIGAHKQRLMSLLGLLVYIIIAFLCSRNRRRVKWRPVMWGLALQFILGLVILRWKIGFKIFNWIGERFRTLLKFSSAGRDFFFKDRFLDLQQLAFVMFPLVAYFSALMHLLWYFGVTAVVVDKLGWLFHITLGTTPSESICAAGNIFLGMVTSPLLVRPFLDRMTESEIHSMMAGGFATIPGSALGIFITMGISPTHLLSASVMSAPAALALSKLMCPETDDMVENTNTNDNDLVIEKPKEKNIFEAAAVGATMSTGLIANIFVCLTAFLSIRELINALLNWFGAMVGEPLLSFELISSYVFMPFAFVMGIPWSDAFTLAKLFGQKIFINEFYAYRNLLTLVRSRDQGAAVALSKRSEVIATYALCAFANVGSMGFTVGGLSALVPAKRQVFAKHVLRALVAGTLATFMTACVAGLLYDEANENNEMLLNSTIAFVNTTKPHF